MQAKLTVFEKAGDRAQAWWRIDIKMYDFELLRNNLFLVIFRLRQSDIFALQKWYWNPISVMLYSSPKGNITRRKPNITAKQYNSP